MMDTINKQFVKKLKKINNNINNVYKEAIINQSEIKDKLSKLNPLVKLKKLDLNNFNKNIIVIDGSVNRVGGIFPHYVDLYRGYGLVLNGEDVVINDIFTPLLSDLENDDGIRDTMLAGIEIEVATQAAINRNVDLIIMDGGLMRYKIEREEQFNRLKDICLENNIVLAGFIKEVKTDILYNHLLSFESQFSIFDKDLLYGVLDIGEAFVLPDDINTKSEKVVSSAIFRTSNHPRVTGLDLLIEQEKDINFVLDLCYTLTPRMSRGVPQIIDIVDSKALLSNQMTEEIVKTYIDRDIYERFFITERSMRKY